jgi:uncharacterized membrane protein (DUF485 family)
MTATHQALRALARKRWRMALALTSLMVLVYFGFVLLVAWYKPFMARLITPGLSIGIVLGALVIVAAWVLTWIYVRWANRVYDPALARARTPAGE